MIVVSYGEISTYSGGPTLDTTNRGHSVRAITRLLGLLDDEIENLVAAVIADPGSGLLDVSSLVKFEDDADEALDTILRALVEHFPEVKEAHPAFQG